MRNILILLTTFGLLSSCADGVPSNYKGAVVIDKYIMGLSKNRKLVLEVDDYDSVIPYKKSLITINVRKYYYNMYNIGDTL